MASLREETSEANPQLNEMNIVYAIVRRQIEISKREDCPIFFEIKGIELKVTPNSSEVLIYLDFVRELKKRYVDGLNSTTVLTKEEVGEMREQFNRR